MSSPAVQSTVEPSGVNNYLDEQLAPKRCHLRIYKCCCCVSLEAGIIAIGVLVFLEIVASLIAFEWINTVLQTGLLIFFFVAACKRDKENVRQVLYQAYGAVLVLSFIELIALVVVYLVAFDTIEKLCEEWQATPPEDELFQFKSQDECEYNIRIVTLAVIVVGSLIYFPLKVHFTLVIRAWYKQKRDQLVVQYLQQAQESERNYQVQMRQLNLQQRQETADALARGLPRTESAGSIDLDMVDQNTRGSLPGAASPERRREEAKEGESPNPLEQLAGVYIREETQWAQRETPGQQLNQPLELGQRGTNKFGQPSAQY